MLIRSWKASPQKLKSFFSEAGKFLIPRWKLQGASTGFRRVCGDFKGLQGLSGELHGCFRLVSGWFSRGYEAPSCGLRVSWGASKSLQEVSVRNFLEASWEFQKDFLAFQRTSVGFRDFISFNEFQGGSRGFQRCFKGFQKRRSCCFRMVSRGFSKVFTFWSWTVSPLLL